MYRISEIHEQRYHLCGGYNYDSTSIRLQFDRATTIQRYGLPVLGYCTAA